MKGGNAREIRDAGACTVESFLFFLTNYLWVRSSESIYLEKGFEICKSLAYFVRYGAHATVHENRMDGKFLVWPYLNPQQVPKVKSL